MFDAFRASMNFHGSHYKDLSASGKVEQLEMPVDLREYQETRKFKFLMLSCICIVYKLYIIQLLGSLSVFCYNQCSLSFQFLCRALNLNSLSGFVNLDSVI